MMMWLILDGKNEQLGIPPASSMAVTQKILVVTPVIRSAITAKLTLAVK